jgi:hypothetical protein
MSHALLNHRWSTLSLVVVSLGLSALAYFSGREAGSRSATRSSGVDPRFQSNQPAAATRPAGVTAPELRSSIPDITGNFDERWKRWSTGHRTPASEREMAAALEELAARDPNRAMSLALDEGNFRLRQNLRHAVLRGWAATAPDDAAAWAMALLGGDRQVAMEAVFAGAARRPEEAAKLGARLCAQEPALAGEYGQFLINGLTEAGAYATAARFAMADTSEHHGAWLNAAFFHWATYQPDQALAAFGKISDPATRIPAFQGMILGWAMANPAAVAAYAVNLAPGENRSQALSQALPQWANRDPVAASEWMFNHFDPSPDLDAGVAAVATMPTFVNQRPEIAVGWAESIADPVLRANTLRLVAQQWAQQDVEAFRRFLASNPDILAVDRLALMDGLNPPPDM